MPMTVTHGQSIACRFEGGMQHRVSYTPPPTYPGTDMYNTAVIRWPYPSTCWTPEPPHIVRLVGDVSVSVMIMERLGW
eukprot:1891286-Pyramimonas_sp.AAC.2